MHSAASTMELSLKRCSKAKRRKRAPVSGETFSESLWLLSAGVAAPFVLCLTRTLTWLPAPPAKPRCQAHLGDARTKSYQLTASKQEAEEAWGGPQTPARWFPR